ncbi:MAG: hypothetical protein FWE82_10575 [Defluviitaleaceae bacterium]|nr:hypothetical protein [Defluviitaleaceae bacterium]
MKYTFNFTEINYGSIEIESDHKPDNGEVTDAIMNGGAFYKNTDYVDIRMIESERKNNQSKRKSRGDR